MKVQISISPGELIDRASILALKKKNINSPKLVEVVTKELESLEQQLTSIYTDQNREILLLKAGQLYEVNRNLWEVEDRLRELESEKDFELDFISLARSVYKLNDRRGQLKREINEAVGGDTVQEVKHYYGSEAVGG